MVRIKNNYNPRFRRYKKEEDIFRNKIEVLFSDKQLNRLKEILQGRSMSHYIREMSLKGADFEKNKPSRSDLLTVAQLRRIGNNLNQISRIYNTNKQHSDFDKHSKEIELVITEIKSTIVLLNNSSQS